MRKVRRSRTVIGRFAGTVSSSGPSSRLRTLRYASSGSSRCTGSSSRSRHSSHRLRADRIDLHLAAPAHQHDDPGHVATLDIAGHDVVHAAEPRPGPPSAPHRGLGAASTTDFNCVSPFSKLPPIIPSMSMNRWTTLGMKLTLPVMLHVTAV